MIESTQAPHALSIVVEIQVHAGGPDPRTLEQIHKAAGGTVPGPTRAVLGREDEREAFVPDRAPDLVDRRTIDQIRASSFGQLSAATRHS